MLLAQCLLIISILPLDQLTFNTTLRGDFQRGFTVYCVMYGIHSQALVTTSWWLGFRLNIRTVFPRYGIPMLKIRRSWDRLFFNMGIPILVRRHLYIEMAPWWPFQYRPRHLSRRSQKVTAIRHLPNSKQYEHFNTQPHRFQTVWDLMIKLLIGYWNGALKLHSGSRCPNTDLSRSPTWEFPLEI